VAARRAASAVVRRDAVEERERASRRIDADGRQIARTVATLVANVEDFSVAAGGEPRRVDKAGGAAELWRREPRHRRERHEAQCLAVKAHGVHALALAVHVPQLLAVRADEQRS